MVGTAQVYAAEGEAAERDLAAATERLTRQAAQLSEARTAKKEAAHKIVKMKERASAAQASVAILEQDKRALLLDKERLQLQLKQAAKIRAEAKAEAEEMGKARAHFEAKMVHDFNSCINTFAFCHCCESMIFLMWEQYLKC